LLGIENFTVVDQHRASGFRWHFFLVKRENMKTLSPEDSKLMPPQKDRLVVFPGVGVISKSSSLDCGNKVVIPRRVPHQNCPNLKKICHQINPL
jgi:hypothetical protein